MRDSQTGTWGVWPMTRRLQLVRSSTCRSWLLAWYLSYRVPKHSWLKVRFHITLRLSLSTKRAAASTAGQVRPLHYSMTTPEKPRRRRQSANYTPW